MSKVCPATVGIEPTTFGILAQSSAEYYRILGRILASNLQASSSPGVDIHSEYNITNIIFT